MQTNFSISKNVVLATKEFSISNEGKTKDKVRQGSSELSAFPIPAGALKNIELI